LLLGAVALGDTRGGATARPGAAGLGIVGAYVTPLLVSTSTPNYWALYLYLAVVTAAGFLLARVRMWRWLALTAIAFGFLWVLPGLESGRAALNADVFHAVADFALVAVLIVAGFLYGPDAAPGRIRRRLVHRPWRLSPRGGAAGRGLAPRYAYAVRLSGARRPRP